MWLVFAWYTLKVEKALHKQFKCQYIYHLERQVCLSECKFVYPAGEDTIRRSLSSFFFSLSFFYSFFRLQPNSV